jgi:STAS-like domain of unknown function (DUF4325)
VRRSPVPPGEGGSFSGLARPLSHGGNGRPEAICLQASRGRTQTDEAEEWERKWCFPHAPDGVLSTRGKGQQVRESIERATAVVTPGHPIALDFSGVQVVSVPFADECIGRLLSGRHAGYYEDHPFLLLNANEDVRETIAATLRLRHLIALAFSEEGAPDLLGADEVLEQTSRVAAELGAFRVNELADRLQLTPQAANNPLRTLLRGGAVRRERVFQSRGGREFEYEVPDSSAA